MSSYDVGDIATLRMTLRDPDTQELADTDTVTLTVRSPSGVVTTPTVENPTLGVWTATVPVDEPGTWRYAFEATGTIEASESGVILVRALFEYPPAFLPDLPAVADYVPMRTLPRDEVGDAAEPANTFTTETTPNEAQAGRLAAAAANWVAVQVGELAPGLTETARDVAAMRAAGLVELSYPRNEDDLNTAKLLLGEARDALAELVATNTGAGGGNPGDASQLVPVGHFPECPGPDFGSYPFY